MIAFSMTMALLITVGLCLAVGVGSGFLLIVGILNLFNPHRQQKSNASALVPSTGPSGD